MTERNKQHNLFQCAASLRYVCVGKHNRKLPALPLCCISFRQYRLGHHIKHTLLHSIPPPFLYTRVHSFPPKSRNIFIIAFSSLLLHHCFFIIASSSSHRFFITHHHTSSQSIVYFHASFHHRSSLSSPSCIFPLFVPFLSQKLP